MAVTAALVKELRERTAAGMLDCKNALVEANGDIELAIENMRKNGQAKAAKKAGRIAAEGVILTKVANGVATMIELNSETDFVARDEGFIAFGSKLIEVASANKLNDIDALNDATVDGVKVSEARDTLVAKIGENISPRRVISVEGDNLGAYVHGGRIGVIAILQGGDEELAKDIAMHVAAANPQFVKPTDVPEEVVAKEKEIQLEDKTVEIPQEPTLEEQLDKEKDKFLRLFAEFENYKRRTSKERIELFKTANQELMTVLLPILDDFERALAHIEDDKEAEELRKGVLLIYQKLVTTLEQKGLAITDVKSGDTFDAEIHEAITQIPAPSKKMKGKIVDVIEKGYKLGDKTIRFPKVVIGQ